jgi:hypothetical protein
MKAQLKQTHFYSDEETLENIKKLKEAGYNMSALIRKALKEAAQKLEK